MAEYTQFTCPKCFHERFMFDGNARDPQNIAGATCERCHYILTNDDIEKYDRRKARGMLAKILNGSGVDEG